MRQITGAVLPNFVWKKGRRSKRVCARALLSCRYLSNQDVWCVFRETHNLTRHGIMAEHHEFSGFSGGPIVLALQLQLVTASLINIRGMHCDHCFGTEVILTQNRKITSVTKLAAF